ncbi:MAG: sel1 repeat family protein [Alphaproteobacteria bacterium]|nr:sel1 repeat family protein [Alphaproteobacteria bacterium]
MRRLHLIIALFLALWTGAAHAGPFEDGVAAAQRGDFATALRLWKPLAEQGDASAQNNLGLMYHNGRGVPQDYVQAHKWFNLAVSRFSADRKEDRDHAVKNRDLAAAKMTPQQIAEAQKLAREWTRKPER